MRQSNKSPKTISRLIDRLEAAREELLKIQRSLEELEAVSESLTGQGRSFPDANSSCPFPKTYRANCQRTLAASAETYSTRLRPISLTQQGF